MKEEDFTYKPFKPSPDFAWLEYYREQLNFSETNYNEALNQLKTLKNEEFKKEDRIVHTVIIPDVGELPSLWGVHPRVVTRVYQEIEAFLQKHKEKNWTFRRVEAEEKENYEPYEDSPSSIDLLLNVVVEIQNKEDIEETIEYKQQLSLCEYWFNDLKIKRHEFEDELRRLQK